MLLNNIQFQLGDDPRSVEIWPATQLRCIRQTYETIEFLREKPNGSTCVMVLEGINVGVLRPCIIHNQLCRFKAGMYDPQSAGIFVTRIYQRLGWTIPKERMAADPNPIPLPLIEFETGLHRDLWQLRHLEAFGIAKSKQPKFLFQFPRHAYVLECSPFQFPKTLEELKQSNIQPGMRNKFSVLPDSAYPQFTDRIQLEQIDCKERDLASQSTWEVLFPEARISRSKTLGHVESLDL